MAKVKGPLFSGTAAGSLAQTLSFLPGAGTPAVRIYRASSFTQSAPQSAQEAMYGFLAREWRTLTSAQRDTWLNAEPQSSRSAYNEYIKANLFRWKNGKAPSQAWPPTETGNPAIITPITATGGRHHASFKFGANPPLQRWGIMIHRSTTAGFPALRNNCIQIIHYITPNTKSWDDLDLTPATYRYRFVRFTTAGFKSTPSAQTTVVVT